MRLFDKTNERQLLDSLSYNLTDPTYWRQTGS